MTVRKRTWQTNETSCPALKIIIFNNKHFQKCKMHINYASNTQGTGVHLCEGVFSTHIYICICGGVVSV